MLFIRRQHLCCLRLDKKSQSKAAKTPQPQQEEEDVRSHSSLTRFPMALRWSLSLSTQRNYGLRLTEETHRSRPQRIHVVPGGRTSTNRPLGSV